MLSMTYSNEDRMTEEHGCLVVTVMFYFPQRLGRRVDYLILFRGLKPPTRLVSTTEMCFGVVLHCFLKIVPSCCACIFQVLAFYGIL